MDLKLIKKIISENNDVAKTSAFAKSGVSAETVANLCKKGVLIRVKHGYYQLASQVEPIEEKVIARLFPDGILCMDTALFHYGYSNRTPLEWTIAFSRNVSRSRLKINYFNLKPYFIDDKFLNIGVTQTKINGVTLKIYDRERVICDCFKYKNKMDVEMFNKAINAYVSDEKKKLGNLSKYAKEMRVYRQVHEIMGVLING